MTFLDELKELYSRNNVKFPETVITDFMLDFVERTYSKMLSSTIKNTDQFAEFLMKS
jgi:hypothetical protein